MKNSVFMEAVDRQIESSPLEIQALGLVAKFYEEKNELKGELVIELRLSN